MAAIDESASGDEPSPEERMRQRLAQLEQELEEVARHRLSFPSGAWGLSAEHSSEPLELEADRLRAQLGLSPGIGRPPRSRWWGWVVLAASAVVIFAVVLWVVI